MLINCPECGREKISDQAKSCPSCGHPVAAVTIEKTAKQWKAMQAWSVAIQIIGIFMLIIGLFVGGILVLSFGVIFYLVVRIKTWWHHG